MVREESFSHMNWPPQSPDFTPLKYFGLKENTEGMVRPKINATLDGNKCCDIAETIPQQMSSVIKAKGGLTKY